MFGLPFEAVEFIVSAVSLRGVVANEHLDWTTGHRSFLADPTKLGIKNKRR